MAKRKTNYEITGAKRKRCQCCGKTLPLRIKIEWRVPEGCDLPKGKRPRVEVKRVFDTFLDSRGHIIFDDDGNIVDKVKAFNVHYWDGEYKGYPIELDKIPSETEYFCTLPCAEAFARAAWIGGIRVKGRRPK